MWEETNFAAQTPAYTIPAPVDVLGAASNADDLEWQFPGQALDAVRRGIAADNASDDEILTGNRNQLRMDLHFECARQVAAEIINAEFEERMRQEEEIKMFEAGYEVPLITDRGLVDRGFSAVRQGGQQREEYDDESPVSSPRQLRRRLARGASYEEEGDEDQEMEDQDQEEYDEETEED
jgi:hypothetical protein